MKSRCFCVYFSGWIWGSFVSHHIWCRQCSSVILLRWNLEPSLFCRKMILWKGEWRIEFKCLPWKRVVRYYHDIAGKEMDDSIYAQPSLREVLHFLVYTKYFGSIHNILSTCPLHLPRLIQVRNKNSNWYSEMTCKIDIEDLESFFLCIHLWILSWVAIDLSEKNCYFVVKSQKIFFTLNWY